MIFTKTREEFRVGRNGGLAFAGRGAAGEQARDLSEHSHDRLYTIYREPDGYLVLDGVMKGAGHVRPLAKYMNGRKL